MPTLAAEASAAFASLLAALALAVSVQVAGQRGESPHGYASVAVAPVSFVTLLIAAYLYVRLAGRLDVSAEFLTSLANPQSLDLVDVPEHTVRDVIGNAQVTVAMFTTAGTLLAIGAVATALVVALAIKEHDVGETTETIGNAAFFGASGAAAIFILDGMYEIGRILAFSVSNGCIRDDRWSAWNVVLIGMLGVVAGIVANAYARRVSMSLVDGGRSEASKRNVVGYAASACIMLVWILPIAWTSVLDAAKSLDAPLLADFLYVSIWFCLFAAAIGVMVAVLTSGNTYERWPRLQAGYSRIDRWLRVDDWPCP